MTNREKVAIEHPERINPKSACGGVRGCPSDLGYPELPASECKGNPESCTRCWGLENPDLSISIVDGHVTVSADTPGIHDYGVGDEPGVSGEDGRPAIKDSGDRTQFESGAVRDMREGKGRCDLMPLEVASHMLENNRKDDQVLALIRIFQKTGSTEALYIALDDFKMSAYDDTKTMLLEVAKHFEEGAKKYGENNWQKGIPVHCYIDSAVRHYLKWLRGDKDEPHDRAFVWNLMCCIWEVDYHKEEQ